MRRRQCQNPECLRFFTTMELLNVRQTAGGLTVEKRDGSVEPFDLDRIRRDIAEALAGPAGEDEVLEAVVSAAGARAAQIGMGRPIPADALEDIILTELTKNRTIYAVSRIRFALGLRGSATEGGFRDVGHLKQWLADDQHWPYGEPHPRQAPLDTSRRVRKRPPKDTQPWDPEKLRDSLRIASRGRDANESDRLAELCIAHVEQNLFSQQRLVSTDQIASEVLDFLRPNDEFAYLRYASAVKRFRTAREFWAEIEDLERHRASGP